MTTKGNRRLTVRLTDELWDALEARAEAAAPGRGGGIGAYVRDVLAAHCGLAAPPLHAQHISPRRLRKRRQPKTEGGTQS